MGENFEEKKCKEIISTVAVILFNKFSGLGIRSLAHRSFAHFPQIKWVIVSNSLRLLKTNERPWAICSGCSEEKSDSERIAQVTQDKWATMSDSLRLLRGNERMSNLLKKNLQKKSKTLLLVGFIYDF